MKYTNMMNHTLLHVAFQATTAFVVRCKPSSKKPPTGSRDTTAQQFGNIEQQAAKVAQERKHEFRQAGQQVNDNIAA